jgi:hypothetical protein
MSEGAFQPAPVEAGSRQLAEVDVVLSRLKRRAKIYQWLGFSVYILGSVGLVRFIPNPQVAMVFQMLLFQCILIYIFTHPEGIFTAMRGAFEVGLIANRQMIPAMEKFADVLGKIEPHVKDGGDLKRMALDFKEEAGMNRPVVPNVPRPVR